VQDNRLCRYRFGGCATAFPPFFAVKNFSCSGFYLVTLFLTVEEKVTGSKGCESKTISGRRAGRWRAASLYLKKLEGNALFPIIKKIFRSFALAPGKWKPPGANSISIHINCPTEFTK
jgi:hypothetical protein